MYPSVANVRKPRQKQSRWLLVDFETNDQAEEFKKILIEKKEIAKIKVKINKLIIKEHDPLDKPENERQQYVNTMTKQSFQSKNLEKYSNKLLVTNLPENVTTAEVSELFPHNLNLDLKHSEIKSHNHIFIREGSDGSSHERQTHHRRTEDSSHFAASRRRITKAKNIGL